MSEKPAQFFIDYDSEFLTKEEAETLELVVAQHYEHIVNTFPTHYKTAPESSLTGRYKYVNWLHLDVFRDIFGPKITKKIRELKPEWKTAYIQCWANNFACNESIGWHRHKHVSDADKFIVGHVFLGGADTSTLYISPDDGSIVNVPNEVGGLSVIPNDVYHCSTPNIGDGIRVTIAVDVYNIDAMDIEFQDYIKKQFWRFIKLDLDKY